MICEIPVGIITFSTVELKYLDRDALTLEPLSISLEQKLSIWLCG